MRNPISLFSSSFILSPDAAVIILKVSCSPRVDRFSFFNHPTPYRTSSWHFTVMSFSNVRVRSSFLILVKKLRVLGEIVGVTGGG